MIHVRPLYAPAPYQDSAERGRVILRDGTTAVLHVAGPEDREALRAFFERLSPESRWRRFFSMSLPAAKLIDSLCDSSDPRAALSLLVTRTCEGARRVIATSSYQRLTATTAALAF